MLLGNNFKFETAEEYNATSDRYITCDFKFDETQYRLELIKRVSTKVIPTE